MYDLPYYKAAPPEIEAFMRRYPFATLIGVAEKPVATRLPFLIEKKEDRLVLRAHLMRDTDHHRALKANPQALILFTGPDAYVSASWYQDPKHGSTWNYLTIQVRGTIQFLPDEDLIELLKDTTDHFEKPDSPARFSELPKGYAEALLQYIEGFSVEVQEIDSVFKLSQDKDQTDYRRIMENLSRGDEAAKSLAALMGHREKFVYEQEINFQPQF